MRLPPRLASTYVTLALAFALGLPALSLARNDGHLVIIGGGSRPDAMMRHIVALAGGDRCRMVVIPMASAAPLDTALYQRWQLEEAGCPEVDFVRFDHEGAQSPELLAELEHATGIFFSGGDQNRLLDAMENTPLLDRVREIHAKGGVIAGTSAGAAVMSRIMITGDERLHPEAPEFGAIRAGNVVTRTGFGFVDLAIIDQHFIARSRHNRLISLVLENPELVGVGIDEATAIVVTGDDRFEVIGEATVVVYVADAVHHLAPDDDGNLAAHGMTLHLLRAGEGFDLRGRRVIEASEP